MIEFFQIALSSNPVMLSVVIAAIVATIGLLVIRIKNGFAGSPFVNRTLELLIVIAIIIAIICTGLLLKSNADYRAESTSTSTVTSTPTSTVPSTATTSKKPSSNSDRPNSGTSLSTLNVTASDARLFTERSAGLGDTLYPNSILYYCLGYGCLNHERSIRFEIDDKYTKFSSVIGVKKDAKDIDQIGEFTLISHGRDGIGKELGRWTVGYTDSPMETGTLDITGTQQLELRVRRTDVPGENEFNAVDLAWGDPKVFP
ncbi:MAG: NPCBM/NEW2 domain-containing protein [Corynebacterium sp.]|nr:NPCBM/NEW2 domain-containing protein [Corynebacterium sp.]